MNYIRDINRLRRYIVLGQVVSLSIFLFGLASVILFFDPSLVRVPEAQRELYRGNWIWLLTGILFIIFAGVCIFIAGKWSRRLIWIYNNVKPEFMKISIEIDSDSDRTNYYAVLSAEQKEIKGSPLWKVTLYSPGWDVELLTEKQVSAKVYFDPESLRPAVIETECGLLWRMAGSGAAERLD